MQSHERIPASPGHILLRSAAAGQRSASEKTDAMPSTIHCIILSENGQDSTSNKVEMQVDGDFSTFNLNHSSGIMAL